MVSRFFFSKEYIRQVVDSFLQGYVYIYNNWEVTSLSSNLVHRNETYLEIERALSRSMNNSSNAINNIIEFADFYLLERSEHRALSFSSSFFFFLVPMPTPVHLNAQLVSFASLLSHSKHIRSIIILQLCHALCAQFRPTFSEE